MAGQSGAGRASSGLEEGILHALRLNGQVQGLCPFVPATHSSVGWVEGESKWIM